MFVVLYVWSVLLLYIVGSHFDDPWRYEQKSFCRTRRINYSPWWSIVVSFLCFGVTDPRFTFLKKCTRWVIQYFLFKIFVCTEFSQISTYPVGKVERNVGHWVFSQSDDSLFVFSCLGVVCRKWFWCRSYVRLSLVCCGMGQWSRLSEVKETSTWFGVVTLYMNSIVCGLSFVYIHLVWSQVWCGCR